MSIPPPAFPAARPSAWTASLSTKIIYFFRTSFQTMISEKRHRDCAAFVVTSWRRSFRRPSVTSFRSPASRISTEDLVPFPMMPSSLSLRMMRVSVVVPTTSQPFHRQCACRSGRKKEDAACLFLKTDGVFRRSHAAPAGSRQARGNMLPHSPVPCPPAVQESRRRLGLPAVPAGHGFFRKKRQEKPTHQALRTLWCTVIPSKSEAVIRQCFTILAQCSSLGTYSSSTSTVTSRLISARRVTPCPFRRL